jgi:butyryl-CoA dehydrogenase
MARAAVIAAAAAGASAGAAATGDASFYRSKLQTARFYAQHLLPQCLGLLRVIQSGGACVSDAEPELIVSR